MGTNFDRTSSVLEGTMKKLSAMAQRGGGGGMCLVVVFVVIVVLVMYLLLQHALSK
jgi:hypothetical protein